MSQLSPDFHYQLGVLLRRLERCDSRYTEHGEFGVFEEVRYELLGRVDDLRSVV